MAILHFGHPALDGRLLVVARQQQLGGVPTLHILQHPDPVVHRGHRVGRQVVDLFAGVDLEGGRTVGFGDAALLVEQDLALRLAVHVVLALPVGEHAVFQHKPAFAPRL